LLSKEINDFYKPYFFNRKNKIPYVTGKIAISKNNLIYSKGTTKITDVYSDKLTHFLRYKNDSLMISYKTLNKDNPKLDCRLEGYNKFSPKRIILDNNLEMDTKSYIFRTGNKNNTVIFYNKASRSKILIFKKKGIQLIKSNLSKNNKFDLKLVLKKLYSLGCRNILVEGGNDLTKSILKNKLFNLFFLFKSEKILSKLAPHKDFNGFKDLTQKYRNKSKIKTQLGKDSITLYKK
jgi:diaminohydroxyphosphoribosylaminopyrimidine deaminase/5-amino-6-(5-phosphoribosylamino)uracil reductase